MCCIPWGNKNSKIHIVGRTTNNIFYYFLDLASMREIDKKRLEKFGLHLKKLREEKGLSIRELASHCDVDYGKISKLENNKANLTVTTLIELAIGLDVHPKELLDFIFE
jgi:DNA-binding Xre family transcriptional regulator